jgi:hypothetical protein
LEDEPRDLIIIQRVKTFVFTDEKFRKMSWNGPEIRNGKQLISVFRDSKAKLTIHAALCIAIALATHDKKGIPRGPYTEVNEVIETNEKYLRSLERREIFIAYRNSIDKRTEEQRAAAAKDRARFSE